MIFLEKPHDFKSRYDVVSCFIECKSELLWVLRQPHKLEGGKWGSVAGKVRKEESVPAALRREVREETGLDLAEKNFKFFKTVFVRYPDYDFVFHVFSCAFLKKPNIVLEKAALSDFCWVTPQQALSLPLVLDADSVLKMYCDI